MTSILVFILVILALLGLSFISMKRASERDKKSFKENCEKQYGKFGRRQVSAELEDALKTYAARRETKGAIDDITWHDLDGTRLYTMINTCVSTCGDVVLYDKMRHPLFDRKDIDAFRALSEAMGKNKDSRLKILKALNTIGRPLKGTGLEALEALETMEDIGIRKYTLLAAATFADIIFLFFMPLMATIIFIILMIVNVYLTLNLRDRTGQAQDGIRLILSLQTAGEDMASSRLEMPGSQLTVIKEEAERLKAFKKGAFLVTGRAQVSESLGSALLTYVNLFFHLDLIKFDRMIKDYKENKASVLALFEAFGELDAAAAAASFEKALPVSCCPTFTEGTQVAMDVTDLIHPFIKNPVSNSVVLEGGTLMTGANASGKSTFLKSCAIGAWLAQTLVLVPAASYKAPILRVMTSMALADDLAKKASYFVVEIRSLKRILDAADDETPLLAIVDEVLRGTNTIERIASSTQILKNLKRPHTLILTATHDHELTVLLENDYTNRHFEETQTESGITFTYKLKDGPASTRNAIALLEIEGYDKAIVENARKLAQTFEKTGEWQA